MIYHQPGIWKPSVEDKMTQLKDALKCQNLKEESLVKFLKGFPIERSRDKSKLIVSTSNSNEQVLVLMILSLLDRNIQTNDEKNYFTPYGVVIPYARQLIEKIESNGACVQLDSNSLIETIQKSIKNGTQIEYQAPRIPGEPRKQLSIYHIKSNKELEEMKSALHFAGINVRPKEGYNIYNFNQCEQNSSSALTLYDESATRIIEQLINKSIDFGNKESFLAFGRGR